MKKCILIVIDSLGVGAAPDAKKYGDEDSNTFGNVSKVNGELNLPTFNRLGFGKITTINGLDSEKYVATVGKLAEKSTGNDSTTGHWEIAGLISESEFNIFPNGFPDNYIGLEWWVQVRNTKEGITFHYDKDEGTCSQKGIYIYPLKSTITYLTDIGGPTSIFNDKSYNNGYLSFPKVNKHVVFDGHLFHGVIGPLGKINPNDDQKRITFLINYWHQKPIEPNCIYFPYDKIKLSPVTDEQKELQSSIQKEKLKIIKMNYQSGVNNIFIERQQKNNQGKFYQKKIPLKIAKNLKEKTTYSFRFNNEVVVYNTNHTY